MLAAYDMTVNFPRLPHPVQVRYSRAYGFGGMKGTGLL